MTAPRQPTPLVPPAAAREAATEEIETLRSFHLDTGRDDLGHGDRPPVSFWSWLLRPESDTATPSSTIPPDLAEPLSRLWRRLTERESAARTAWLDETRRLRRGLRSILERHPAPDGEESAERLRQGLGDVGSRFVDSAALSTRLSAAGGPLAPQQRERIERALEILERVDRPDASTAPNGALICDGTLVHRFGAGALGECLEDAGPPPRLELADEPCGQLADAFDRRAAELAEAVGAARVARLELEDAYRPERHDAALASFDWQAFHREELGLLPPLVAVLSADTMTGASLGPLFRLLLSGRPVQVVVFSDPASSPGAGLGLASSAYRFEPGLLALGLRHALVHQGSSACPEALERAVATGAEAPHGSLFVLAAPSLAGPAAGGPCNADVDPATLSRLALASRSHPVFSAEPTDLDPSSRRRPILDGLGPDAEDLPSGGAVHTFELVDGQNGSAGPSTAGPPTTRCTFADYALACGCFPGDFVAVDDELQHESLVPLADWLTLSEPDTHDRLPFVWAVTGLGDESGNGDPPRLERLVTTRRLALCARDRLDSWRSLVELAVRPETAPTTAEGEDAAVESAGATPSISLDEQRAALTREIVAKLVGALVGDPTAESAAPAKEPEPTADA